MSACLPLTLLASIPMMLQADVSDPAFLKLADDQRPMSSLSRPESIVDTQPTRKATAAPVYRRFSTFERKFQPESDDFAIFSDQNREPQLSDRKRRARSVPIDLRCIPEHDNWIDKTPGETTKRKGKQRASSLEATIPDLESTVLLEPDATPRRRRSESSCPDAECSVTASSYSLRPQKLDSSSTILPSPQLQTLNEEIELDTLDPTIDLRDFSPSQVHTAHGKNFNRESESFTPIASFRSLKRVSFCTGGNAVIPKSEIVVDANSKKQPQSTWSNILFMKAGPRPLLARQTSLPTVRGQAAGRSILKRTTSFSTYPLQESAQGGRSDVELNLLPTPGRDSAHSLRLPDDPVMMGSPSRLSCDDKAETGLVCDAVEATIHKAETIIVLPARPRKTKTSLSREQNTVRHWSMEGLKWTRRSGVYAIPRLPQIRTS